MRAYAALLGGVLGCADALPVPGTDAHAVSVVEAYLASPEPGLRAMAADLVGRRLAGKRGLQMRRVRAQRGFAAAPHRLALEWA